MHGSSGRELVQMFILPELLQADKHTLVTELDIPYRDLRILDPKVRSTAQQVPSTTVVTAYLGNLSSCT